MLVFCQEHSGARRQTLRISNVSRIFSIVVLIPGNIPNRDNPSKAFPKLFKLRQLYSFPVYLTPQLRLARTLDEHSAKRFIVVQRNYDMQLGEKIGGVQL